MSNGINYSSGKLTITVDGNEILTASADGVNVSGNLLLNGQAITGSSGNTYNTTLNVAPTAVYNSNVALLLDFSGSDNSTYFVDKSFNALSITPQGNAKISVTESKFGGSSGYFDGSGDYLKVAPSNRLDFGTGDFTLETWIYPADLTYRFICGATTNGGSYLMLAINPTAGDQIWMGRSGVDWPLQFSGHTLTASVWSHLAISRQGDQNKLFINGTQIGSAITDTTSWSVDPNGFWIGSQGGGNSYNGYLDDFRITKGIALYTGSFTAPTQELTGGLTYVQSEYSGTFNLTGNLNVSGAINTIGTNTWNKPQVAAITSLTSTSNSTAVDLASSNNYKIVMTENTQLANPTNATEGQSGIITIVQPAGTYYTMSYGTYWKFASGSDNVLTARTGAIDVLAYYVASSSYAICNLIKDFA